MLENNAPAIGFYEHYGFRMDGAALDRGCLAFRLTDGGVYLFYAVVKRAGGLFVLLRSLKQPVVLALQSALVVLRHLKLVGAESAIRRGLVNVASEFFNVKKPKRYVELLFLVVQLHVFSRLGGIFFERTYAALYLIENILHTGHVAFAFAELFLGLVLLISVFRYARSLLEYTSAVLALFGDYLRDLALTDYGIALSAYTGIHEKLINIAQAAGLAVYKILTLARAVVPTGDRYLFIGAIELSGRLGIVKCDGDLRKAHGTVTVRADENNVLHFGAADVLCGYFAEHPTHGVRDIGLTASVGAYNYGRARVEAQHCFIREGFKAVKFKRFEIHCLFLPFLPN